MEIHRREPESSRWQERSPDHSHANDQVDYKNMLMIKMMLMIMVMLIIREQPVARAVIFLSSWYFADYDDHLD